MKRPLRPVLKVLTALTLLVTAGASVRAGDVVEYVVLDGLGNVRVVEDEKGNVLERHDYLAFGEECTTGKCASNPGVGAGEPLKFTGKERDQETGLDYFGARYYKANVGRFTTVDPVYKWNDNLLDAQLWNRYAYARNNPFRYVDPDGRETVLLHGGRTASNVFGHAAIGINGQVFSFGTNWTQGAPAQDWGVDQSAYLAAQNDIRATDILTLNISDTQERALLKHLQENNPNASGAPPYALLSNSCTTVCKRSLERTGILPDQADPAVIVGAGRISTPESPSTPDALVQSVRRAGLVKSADRVGQEKASWFKSAVNTIKEDASH